MRGCPLTLYTLTPMGKFSVLFFQIFPGVLSRRNCLTIRNVSSSQHFLYSNDFNFWFRGDTIGEKFDVLCYGRELRFTRLEIHCETLSIFFNWNFQQKLWITLSTVADNASNQRARVYDFAHVRPMRKSPPISLKCYNYDTGEGPKQLHPRILVKMCALIIVTEVEREILAVV